MARHIDPKSLHRINAESIQAAGPRYTPAVEAGAPNIEIKELLDSIEALGVSDQYRQSVSRMETELAESWKKAPRSVTRLFKNRACTPSSCGHLLHELREKPPGGSRNTLIRLKRETGYVLSTLNTRMSKLWDEQGKHQEHSQEAREIDDELRDLRRTIGNLRDLSRFVESPDLALIENNCLFIHGEWGTGKTHFLCDVTRSRKKRGLATVFYLAHRLPTDRDPLTAICRVSGLARTPDSLLRKLNALGRKKNGRALIVIDGINESDRAYWRDSIGQLTQKMRSYNNVGLVLSCRTPFDTQILTSRTRKKFVHCTHVGFEEIELDAQREFFRFYDIPTPNVPLLTPEFSRPLFLKILCKTLSGRTRTQKSRWLQDIASGQKGMTKLLEDFVRHAGREAESQFRLPDGFCWKLFKGSKSPVDGSQLGIAISMASNASDFIAADECKAVIANLSGLSESQVAGLLRHLISDGLLAEDVIYEDGVLQEVVRLPYQRFSDHLIARHLLQELQNASSDSAVRRAFHRNRTLGSIFDLDDWGRTYRRPGLASAIMLEFPERIKRIPDARDSELIYFLPKRTRMLAPFVEAFLSGLPWRDQTSFTDQTDNLVSQLLVRGDQRTRFETLETLIVLASRTDHPYSATRLLSYLRKKTLVERDTLWSEFLRNRHGDSAIYRVLNWIEGWPADEVVSEAAVGNLAQLCATMLTSTHRPLRDEATKALVILGERSPRTLFDTTLSLLGFNDPYVPERMLAASYGVLMRNWAFPPRQLVGDAAAFARSLFDQMFERRSRYRTKHILTRDYARGIIELASKISRNCLGKRNRELLKPPFSAMRLRMPSADRISDASVKGADRALMMDFRNYTVGRLVSDRSPYQDNHPQYRELLRQLKWRILELGYDHRVFEDIDSSISQQNYEFGRSD